MAESGDRYISKDVWATAALLATLLLASLVVVAFVISQVADRTAELSFGSGGEVATASTAQAAIALAAESPGTLVQDASGVAWSSQAVSVDIFKDRYLGPDGSAVTVQSADGSKVVAPGVDGVYEFATRNAVEAEIDYRLTAEVVVSSPDVGELPLEGRLRSPDGWLVGADDAWVPLAEMNDLEDVVELEPHQSRAYSFEWRWRYERPEGAGLVAHDAQDLALADIAAGDSCQDLSVQVVLSAVGSYDELPASAGPPEGSGPLGDVGSLLLGNSVATIFPYVAVAVACFAAILSILTAMALSRRRERERAELYVGGSAAPLEGGGSHA